MTTGSTGTSRRRNGPRRRRTHGPFPPQRRPGTASAGCREKPLGSRRARPTFFWRHGDHADALKFQAHVLEELPHLAGAAPQSGQLKDAVAGLGDGVDRLLLEGRANEVAIGGHLALGTMGVARPETFQAPQTKGDDVAMDGGPTR